MNIYNLIDYTKKSRNIKNLIECVKNCTEIKYDESSAYKLPPRFYKPVDKGMFHIEAFGEERGSSKPCVLGITGANKKFVVSEEDSVKGIAERYWSEQDNMFLNGFFSSGRPIEVCEDDYYFLYGCCNYDMSFICKSIDRSKDIIKVVGFTREEVTQIIAKAGVKYEHTNEYFKRLQDMGVSY